MIFAAIVAALALVSCSKEENRSCYQVEYTIPAQEAVINELGEIVRQEKPETKFEGYKWATEAEIDACLKNWESMGYKNAIATKIETKGEGETQTPIRTMADCLGSID